MRVAVKKPRPPFGRQVAAILADQTQLEKYSGCTRYRASVWICTGLDGWDWHDEHPKHLSVVLPQGENPFNFRWDFIKGHEPALILPPVANDSEQRRDLAAAILADGVQSVLAGSIRFAQG